MSCCRKLKHHSSGDNSRGVFCLNWVLPLRILVIASLAAHFLYKLFHQPPPYAVILTVAHIVFSFLILAECRRSIRYHKAIKELEAIAARRRALNLKN